jgi:hypothetical protein
LLPRGPASLFAQARRHLQRGSCFAITAVIRAYQAPGAIYEFSIEAKWEREFRRYTSPFTSIVNAVTNDERSEVRKGIKLLISAGVGMRPKGMPATIRSALPDSFCLRECQLRPCRVPQFDRKRRKCRRFRPLHAHYKWLAMDRKRPRKSRSSECLLPERGTAIGCIL